MARKRTSLPNQIIKAIVERDGSTNCKYCGKNGDSKLFYGTSGRGNYLWIEHEIDHVIPLSEGGTNNLENLVIACRQCNSEKRAKMGWTYGTPQDDRSKLLAE